MRRGLLFCAVISPNAPLVGDTFGAAKRGWFIAFRKSPRSCQVNFSPVFTALRAERSKFEIPGPRTLERRRGRVWGLLARWAPLAFTKPAFVLNHSAPLR